MEVIDDIVNYLKAWESKYQQIQEAVTSCNKWLNDFSLEEMQKNKNDKRTVNGFPLENIFVKFNRQVISFNHSEINYPFVETKLAIYYTQVKGKKTNNLYIGHYLLITKLNGKVDDDYLIIEKANLE